MKTRIITVNEGEWLGPVDPNYDWKSLCWDRDKGKGGVNPLCVEEGHKIILEINKTYISREKGWKYSPCFLSSRKIVNVGMYNGWPFWKPTPAIGYIGPLGRIEVAFFYNLCEDNCFRPVR